MKVTLILHEHCCNPRQVMNHKLKMYETVLIHMQENSRRPKVSVPCLSKAIRLATLAG